MKKIKKKLEKLKSQTEEKIHEREDYFNDQPLRWQESERGFEHQEKTKALKYILNKLNFALSSLVSYY